MKLTKEQNKMIITYPKIEASPDVFTRIKECEKFIDENLQFEESWIKCWEVLERLKVTNVYLDFAPMSFMWQGAGMIGGLIFHGPHDRGGDGGAPTFSVNIDKSYGWSLHT